MADTDEDQRAAVRLMGNLRAKLRDEFPYMKLEAVGSLVNRCSDELTKGITEQQPVMNATKARISFMSLSAELRNRIYWLVLGPNPDDPEDQYKYGWDGDKPIIEVQSEYADKDGYDPECDTEWLRQLGLTKVSRQIREEALSFYYGSFEFRVYGSGSLSQLSAAMDRLGRIDTRHIKCLRVLYKYNDPAKNLKEETIKTFGAPARSTIVMVRRERDAAAAAAGTMWKDGQQLYEEI